MRKLLFQLVLLLAALGAGPAGAAEEELSGPRLRGLQLALEDFHKHPPVQWAFKNIQLLSASDLEFSAGTFVKLQFRLQQTSCPKREWRNSDCKLKPNGRKRICQACFKFDSKDQVLKRMVHCPMDSPNGRKDLEEQWEKQCSMVEQAGESPSNYYFPGQFAFSRALPRS
ncbi:retinoic acid receptor responder protein 2 [Ornithorhynchus anatinus]|uniref:retinoic acid receptor responder protein 2 n=1 Tax=Ornithorhynchus anatinus TaxID=9258 RepID=UPI0010A8FB3C|nr:retinoic acid receptor responder protein 2 [Ornithorhynchus anatinus]XP_028933428.1 retinoic acid receptor responder protein 2 [Ornithorhynchus anatinus]XP_028933429.1 retinoic acid receptor responder protein 2 [Ornithorhynchus anatinus]XP_028933430.1 retinoic acid receptor responder protein 2 [Ornithorhynchus anatinus]